MSLRVLIVDDEALAAERLASLCAQIENLEVVGVAQDGWTALAQIDDFAPDAVLLDVAMPGLDGMALARALAARERPPAIVFVTANSDFAVMAFELAATDYLLKPVSLQRLETALARARAARSRPAPPLLGYLTEIWAPRSREMTRVGIETIDFVEAERDYVRLHARGQAYLLRTTLRELERRLDPDRFVRTHRSTIVARDRISALRSDPGGGWTVLLSTGQDIKVGRSYKPMVRKLVGRT